MLVPFGPWPFDKGCKKLKKLKNIHQGSGVGFSVGGLGRYSHFGGWVGAATSISVGGLGPLQPLPLPPPYNLPMSTLQPAGVLSYVPVVPQVTSKLGVPW